MNSRTKKIIELLNQPGAFNKISFQRRLKTRKGIVAVIEKQCESIISSGTDFSNRKDVKDAIEKGERGIVGELPFGKWELFPFLISHTNKDGEHKEYLRVYPPSNAQEQSFDFKTKVKFLLNGVEVQKEQIKDLCLASETSEKEKPECMTISVDNIIKVGDVEI